MSRTDPPAPVVNPVPYLNPQAFGLVLETIVDGVYVVDPDRRIVLWNKAAEKLSGYPAAQVLGRYCHDGILAHVNDSGEALCHNGCPLAATICDQRCRDANVFMHHKNGHRVPVHVNAAALVDADGKTLGAVEVFRENSSQVTARKAIRTLASLALHDALTDLANRRCMELRLKARLAESQSSEAPLCVLMLDIDNFKKVNDVHGHEVGDRAIQLVANSLAKCLPNATLAGRWGGEEFLAVLEHMKLSEGKKCAEQARMLIEKGSLSLPKGLLHITVSIGVAQATAEDTPESLVERADKALYFSKRAGRNRVSLAA